MRGASEDSDYIKHYTVTEDGKVFDVLYNPKEKDASKAYKKVEVKA